MQCLSTRIQRFCLVYKMYNKNENILSFEHFGVYSYIVYHFTVAI